MRTNDGSRAAVRAAIESAEEIHDPDPACSGLTPPGEVPASDERNAESDGKKGARGPAQADILITIAEAAELFQTPENIAFADIDIDGHRETWPIRGKSFRHWLVKRFYQSTRGAPNSRRCKLR